MDLWQTGYRRWTLKITVFVLEIILVRTMLHLRIQILEIGSTRNTITFPVLEVSGTSPVSYTVDNFAVILQ